MKAVAAFSLLAPAAALVLASCAARPGPPAGPGPMQLAGTSWRVVSVNARPTPVQGDYSMRFEADGRLGARFGCNHIGGTYLLYVSTLTVRNLIQTQMGCPEPAMTFETQGSMILQKPMNVASPGGGQASLSNDSGTILLTRAN